MPVYSDAETLYRCVGMLFDSALDSDGLGETLRAFGLSFRMHLTDPNATVSIDCSCGAVEFGESSTLPAKVELWLTGDTAHGLLAGTVNVPLAVAKGTIKAKGSMATLLMIAPVIAPLSAEYVQRTREITSAAALS